MSLTGLPCIGVVIVTFNAEPVIEDCLRSLHLSDYPNLKIVVVDNASTDNTRDVIRNWAGTNLRLMELAASPNHSDDLRSADLILLRSDFNRGFAGGVNMGLRLLLRDPGLELFWILNPDCRVLPGTAANYAKCAVETGYFGLMGGRTVYVSPKDTIQSDGGRLNAWTGMCVSFNSGRPCTDTPYPSATEFDYISGSNMVASRAFLDAVGLMDERYFLYYEEVDWALRRGELQLVYAPGAVVEHHGGSSIGSPVLGKEQGSSFSNYFNYRNRVRFMRRFFPRRLIVVYAYSAMKIIRLVAQGFHEEASGAFRGLFNLPPPRGVRSRLTKDAARIAFGGVA